MKNAKRLLSIILTLTVVLGLSACGGTPAPGAAGAAGNDAAGTEDNQEAAGSDADADSYYIELTYSNVFNPKEWNYKAAEKFAEMVTERTEGHVKVDFHGLNELDCYRDSVVHAVNGDKWIGLEEPSLFADWVGDCAVLVGPMLYNSDEEYNYVMDSELVDAVKAKLAEENIHILDTHYSFGFRSVVTNKDIRTPEDLKGVKLRSTTAALFIKTIEAMGATPVPMSFTECLSSISSGVVDGFEGSTSTLAGAGAPYEPMNVH